MCVCVCVYIYICVRACVWCVCVFQFISWNKKDGVLKLVVFTIYVFVLIAITATIFCFSMRSTQE